MDNLSSEQWDLAQAMERLYVNMKKDSSSRKNQDYIVNHHQKCDEIWKKFKENDQKMVKYNEPDHKYFKDDLFGQTKKIYLNIKALLQDYETKLKDNKKPSIVTVGQEASASGSPTIAQSKKSDTDSNLESKGSKLQDCDTVQAMRCKRLQIRLNHLDRLINEVQNNMNNGSKGFFEIKRTLVKETWERAVELHEEIMVNENDSEKQKVLQLQLEEYENAVEGIIVQLQEKLSQQEGRQDVRLPKIVIPEFDGSYKMWPSFHDMFVKMIHENKQINSASKMHYLKGYMQGEAAKLINHLEISDSNYNAAWQIINNRYNNERLLLNTQLDNLMNQPRIGKASAKELKRLHDNIIEAIQAIKSQKVSTGDWGPLLCYIISRKLDKETFRLYEQVLKDPKAIEDFDNLMNFIEARFQSLESIESSTINENERHVHEKIFPKIQKPFKSYHAEIKYKCYLCNGNHSIFKCPKKESMKAAEKLSMIKKHKLCRRCLRKGHDVTRCTSKVTCNICNEQHNTLLHEERFTTSRNNKREKEFKNENSNVTSLVSTRTQDSPQVLLATAIVRIKAKDGSCHFLRALIDQGSQASFISERAVQHLRLTKTRISITVTGINQDKPSHSSSSVQLTLLPRISSEFFTNTTAYVLDKLIFTANTVSNLRNYSYLQHILLADPEYMLRKKIDLILGAEVYADIILDGLIKGPSNAPIAQQTHFGWIISGKCGNIDKRELEVTSLITSVEIDEMKKYWELEEVSEERNFTKEEKECIEQFEKTVSRDHNGRYIVRLPFNKVENDELLGESKKTALSRFFHIERKFRSNTQLAEDYKKFMQEYLDLGHMKLAMPESKQGYYLPHHAVIKQDSTTTKLRVVFDGSAKTSNGESLNSVLKTGPTLQSDLVDIILRWRKYKFAVKADIEKMYRQIWVHSDDQKYQKILWRFSEKENIKEYLLTTVTYGTRPAPFLAVKSLQKLAEDEGQNYPYGAKTVIQDFYVDDMITGASSIEEVRIKIHETINLLKKGGFNLRKWCSNDSKALQDIPKEAVEVDTEQVSFDETVKTLGLHWYPKEDTFGFKLKFVEEDSRLTKRKLLSETSKLYDPIGWLAPLIIRSKLMFQELWLLNLQWDDILPEHISSSWNQFKKDLILIEKLRIPRWIGYKSKNSPVELHGFCDASEKAYAAAVYLKSYDNNGSITTFLLASKTKVAPIKQKLSIAKLELCGAQLLSKLMRKLCKALEIQFLKLYAWTDSEIVLAWIKGDPQKYKTFVANRISNIQGTIQPNNWYHIKSKENPADYASRGLTAKNLLENKLWWSGPDFLRKKQLEYCDEYKETKEEYKTKIKSSFIAEINEDSQCIQIMNKYSCLDKGIRVLAYCNRFLHNVKPKNIKRTGALMSEEILQALQMVIKAIQQNEFTNEIKDLTNKNCVSNKSSLFCLHPFIDADGILRVGGRLQKADFKYDTKHPVILPYTHHFTTLVIDKAHKMTMHGGVNLTLANIRQKYWIIKGCKAVKRHINNCIKCIRHNARMQQQLMGSLPKSRLQANKAFNTTGIDYAGPLTIKMAKGRGAKTTKGYIALFICFSTKAIHLEAVSDLSADAFLAAFKRFIGRRGIPKKLYSDNATNFQLASKILDKNLQEFKKEFQDVLVNEMMKYQTQWSFIPPSAPHFGGIWEAGVKSVKGHLVRTLGNTLLTFEELATVLIQIEACLNSRPLQPLTEDPESLDVLTPGHFLTGEPLLAIPEKTTDEVITSLKSRWKFLEHLHQEFWRKWSTQYIHHLQKRPKWLYTTKNIQVDSIVLLKDELLPPTQWPLGRIIETHPGDDGLIRVVTVKIRDKLFKRPITKLCLLPIETSVQNQQEEATAQKRRNTEINKKGLCTYNITYPPAGFYIEDIGKSKIRRGTLKIDFEYPISIERDIEEVNKTISNMEEICQKAKQEIRYLHCDVLVHHLKEQQDKLLDNYRIFAVKNEKRKRRGLLGQLLQSIFGVNDEVYRDINTLHTNQQTLWQASSQQTNIMIATSALMNDTQVKVSEKLNKFGIKLNQVIEHVNAMNWLSANANHVNVQILAAYQYASTALKDLHDYYSKLAPVIFGQGKISELVSPSKLLQVIKNTTLKLPAYLTVSNNPENKLEWKLYDSKVMITGFFAIAETNEYTLIKVTPTPKENVNKIFSVIQLAKSTIAIDYNAQNYFELSELELNQCVQQKEYLLCSPSVVSNMETNPNCIISKIYKQLTPAKCEVRQFKLNNMLWKHLSLPSSWLFITTTSTRISITCSGIREEATLNGTGIIRIGKDCFIRSQKNVLKPDLTDNITIRGTYVKSINIEFENHTSHEVYEHLEPEPVLKLHDDFAGIQLKEKNIQKKLSAWIHVTPHVISSSCILILAAVIVWITIVYRKKSSTSPAEFILNIFKSTPSDKGTPEQGPGGC